VMTVLALVATDVHWSSGSAADPGAKFTAITQLLTAIGIGWGITWVPYASDYSRFVRVNVSSRAVFWSSALGMYVPTVWLAALGACLASAGSGSDPAALVVSTFGVMAVPVLLLLVHGPIATNILNLYSCSLAALSIGVRAARWKITLVAGLVASVVLAVFVGADSFAHAFDNWMVSILVWISPWAAIILVDYFLLRRGRLDVAALYERLGEAAYPSVNSPGLISLAAGILAGWSWQYGLVPAMQGPVATALGNSDFSWLSGSIVAGGLYYVLARRTESPRG
jgi:nucleobase:cation symporter-1, NCS1 family